MTKNTVVVSARTTKVSHKVQAFLNVSRAANTISGYGCDVRSFIKFGGLIPCRPEVVAEFLAAEADTKAYATLRRKVAAIALAHQQNGYVSPCHAEIVNATLRGIRRSKPNIVRRMKPLLAEQVIAATRSLTGLSGIRDRALLLVGFAGAFRRSELVALNVEDLELRGHELIVHVRSSKTDQLKQGREVHIPCGHGKRCPINALRRWFTASAIRTGAVFRAVNRHGRVREPRLSADSVSSIVKRCVAALGLDTREYSGHSLRAGYVTSAAMRGMPAWEIKRQTGHRTDTMLELYVRLPEKMTALSLL